MAEAAERQEKKQAGFRTLVRFLPMLWPKGETELKARVIAAVVLVLAGKAATLVMPFAYKAVIDRMSGPAVAFGVVAMLVVAYAVARFAGVLADNLRNALFEKVGQGAARRLSGQVFRHIHDLSLRFHLERRTGSLTKIVERGTKSIDMMLYFILFNIAPTAIELIAPRTRTLSTEQILASLTSLRLVRGGRHTRCPRHRAFESTVQWSYDLLDETERRLFDCLVGLPQPFDLAQARLAARLLRLDVEHTLDRLVEKSLVMVDADGRHPQYWFLATTRMFAHAAQRERVLQPR